MRRHMNRLYKICSMVFICSFASRFSAQMAPRFHARVSTITAKLFYNEAGTFSENILDNPDIHLWNTVIGEGSAQSPSDSTLILVEVEGDGRANVLDSADVLTVTTQLSGKPAVVKHYRDLSFSREGKHYEAVWLNDTGCIPVTISASVGTQRPIRKRIDFACGE